MFIVWNQCDTRLFHIDHLRSTNIQMNTPLKKIHSNAFGLYHNVFDVFDLYLEAFFYTKSNLQLRRDFDQEPP
jgi:hypothetical protein